MRINKHKDSKIDLNDFLGGKNVVLRFFSQKGAEWLWNINPWNFSDFLHKVTAQRLRTDSNEFLS